MIGNLSSSNNLCNQLQIYKQILPENPLVKSNSVHIGALRRVPGKPAQALQTAESPDYDNSTMFNGIRLYSPLQRKTGHLAHHRQLKQVPELPEERLQQDFLHFRHPSPSLSSLDPDN